MPPLSARLQSIYEHLLPGEPVWDVCCDHGKLGQQALRSGQFPRVNFVDRAAHLIHPLRQKLGFDQRAQFFPVAAEQVNEEWSGTVVIAGVGAHLIKDILSEVIPRAVRVQRWILGPHRHEEDLQKLLEANLIFHRQFHLQKEWSVTERDRARKFLVFDRVSDFRP